MNTITFKGKEYPSRTFLVKMDDDLGEREITISTQSLSDDMGEEKEVEMTAANDLDCDIYFYITDEDINLPAEEICKNHLDEPIEFIEEIN